jgi:hypothetical protein
MVAAMATAGFVLGFFTPIGSAPKATPTAESLNHAIGVALHMPSRLAYASK